MLRLAVCGISCRKITKKTRCKSIRATTRSCVTNFKMVSSKPTTTTGVACRRFLSGVNASYVETTVCAPGTIEKDTLRLYPPFLFYPPPAPQETPKISRKPRRSSGSLYSVSRPVPCQPAPSQHQGLHLYKDVPYYSYVCRLEARASL